MPSFFQQRIKSFGYAFAGIATLFRTQVHARIHLLATALVLAAGFYFDVSPTEWAFLIFSIILVLAAEAFNTSIELLTDLVSPDYHPLAGKAKDVAAAAVLICAVGAVTVGILLLGPYFLQLFYTF